MGYVPTTFLIVWPPSLDKWHTEASNLGRLPGGTPIRTGLYHELVDRHQRIGMWGWQERLYVQSLKWSADAPDESGARWRFLPLAEFSSYSWQPHACDPGCGIDFHRRRCPGEGATVFFANPRADHAIWTVRVLAEIISYREVTGRGGSSGIDPMPERRVSVITEPSNWPPNSRFAPYFTDRVGVPVMQAGIEALRHKAGWNATVGRTSVPDQPVVIYAKRRMLRRFDLSAIYERARDPSLAMTTSEQDEMILMAVVYMHLGEINEVTSGEDLASLFTLNLGNDLFVADRPDILDLVEEKLKAFHETVYPGFWRDQPKD